MTTTESLTGEATNLDSTLETFDAHLKKASEVIVRLYEGIDRVRITPARGRREIAALFEESLPEEPQSMDAILADIEEHIVANSAMALSPRFLGYINSGGNQAAVVAEALASAMNQICAKWQFSPAASEVERRVVQWIAEFIGYTPDAGGTLLSGGSAGNLVGLALARTHRAPFDAATRGMRGGPPLMVYASTEAHASIEKSMVLLGMGREHLRRIPVGDDFAMDLGALEEQVDSDLRDGVHPMCIVGSAGTTNTGAVDPLAELATFARSRRMWFHVDAAYGGPAAQTTPAGHLFRGLSEADSVVVNPHKWLFVPVEAAAILVRDPSTLRRAFQIEAEYFGSEYGVDGDATFDFKDHGPQLSRSFRALKVWMTFKHYGARRLRAAIESNIEIMRYLAAEVDRAPDFVRLAPVPLSVVCFQYRTNDVRVHQDRELLNALNERLLRAVEIDGRVFLSGTTLRGRSVLRACSVNHRLCRGDADLVMKVVREVAASLT